MNDCKFMGRITQEVELKQTQGGIAYINFTIAVDGRPNKDGEKTTQFVNCVAWRGTAETIAKYFHKGDGIIVSGSMENSPYEKDGVKMQSWKEIVEKFYFPCGKKTNGAPIENTTPVFTENTDMGDLPF